FAVAAIPAHAAKTGATASPLPERGRDREGVTTNVKRATPTPTRGGSRPNSRQPQCSCSPANQDSLFPIRPIRLLERPEPIEATAEIPDGPPAQFTWRRVNYRVIHAEGPERIAMQWWRDEQGKMLTRDYFRIQ